MPEVGAVIVDYGAREKLTQCVNSLISENVKDIVVVDNGTCEGKARSRDFVDGTLIKVIEMPINIGYGGAINVGARKLDTELFIASNPDVIIKGGAIGILKEVFGVDPKASIVGPKVITGGETYLSARRFPNAFHAGLHALIGPVFKNNSFSKKYKGIDFIGECQRLKVDWVSGCFMMIDKRAFEDIMGFDPIYFMYLEDVDVCWRMRERGYFIYYEPRAAIYHDQGLTTAKNSIKAIISHHLSAMYFEKKTARGLRRQLLPVAYLILLSRMSIAIVFEVKKLISESFKSR